MNTSGLKLLAFSLAGILLLTVSIATLGLLVNVGDASVAKPTCCIKHAYCCSAERSCCRRAEAVNVETEPVAATSVVAKPTCCMKRAYCCSVHRPCCHGAATEIAA